MPREKKLSLEEAKAFVNSKIEKGGVLTFSDKADGTVSVISTGSMLLDYATGIGGIPRGKLTEIFGPPSSGKTTIMLTCAKFCQQMNMPVLWLDYEHAFDIKYAQKIGLDLSGDKLIVGQPDNFENGIRIATTYIQNDLVGLVVVDSLAAMVTKKEADGEVGDQQVAVLARGMSQELKKLNGLIDTSQVSVVFINHIRDVIESSPMARKLGIQRKTTPGGVTLKFYSSVRIEVNVIESIKGKILDPITGKPIEGAVATKVRATVVKNKCAAPFREARMYIRFDRGIDELMTAIDICIGRGLITKHGANQYVVPAGLACDSNQKIVMGMAGLYRFLVEDATRLKGVLDTARELIQTGGSQNGTSASIGEDESGGTAEGEEGDVGFLDEVGKDG